MPYIEVPAAYRDAMVARLKIMCDLDISEKRKPQDGKIKFKKFGPLDIELRVATLPSAGGGRCGDAHPVSGRAHSAGQAGPHAAQHGPSHGHSQQALWFVLCGPTGSGKTTTLHSILKSLNTPETKIWTAEDPVEITKGLRQFRSTKSWHRLCAGDAGLLRADPDIIMVGESRDKETVSMGGSLTGHWCFNAAHNSAPEVHYPVARHGHGSLSTLLMPCWAFGATSGQNAVQCKEAYAPDYPELKSFIREYTQDLNSTPRFWRANPPMPSKSC